MNRLQGQLQRIAAFINQADDFLVFSHERPDADSIGSSLALAEALRTLGKRVRVFLSPQHRYQFALGDDPIYGVEDLPTDPGACPVIVLDGEPDRTGEFADFTRRAKVVVNIDHHASNRGQGPYYLIVPEASACAELVYYLIETLGVPLNPRMANSLYMAIVGDTGGFRFSNTSARVLEIASRLVAAGARPEEVATNLFMRRPLAYFRLLSLALGRMRIDAEGKVVSMVVSQEDLRQTGAGEDDLEGLVDYPRMVEGVEVALLFKDLGEDTVTVSFRSTGTVDVSKIAAEFGGGGHVKASGCTVKGSLEEVCTKVIQRVCQAI